MGISWISVLKFLLLWLIALIQMTLETKSQCYEKAGQAFCIWMELESRATRHPSFCNFPHIYDWSLIKWFFFPVSPQNSDSFVLFHFFKGWVRILFSKSIFNSVSLFRQFHLCYEMLRIHVFNPKNAVFICDVGWSSH